MSLASSPAAEVNARGIRTKVAWAVAFRAPSIDVPQYLRYLQERARELGVVLIRERLPTDAGFEAALQAAEGVVHMNVQSRIDCFVNATGLGALKLCGDKALFPVRGQTVLVKGEASAIRTRVGAEYTAYCIPRPGSGTTILGGTKEEGNWSEEIDVQTTDQILDRNRCLAPELLTAEDGGFEVVSVQSGLRPARKGGPRIEAEVVGGRRVVHAYGHAGAGYQNSVGSAREVVRLTANSIGSGGGRVASL